MFPAKSGSAAIALALLLSTRRLAERYARWTTADSLASVADSVDYQVRVTLSHDSANVSYVWYAPGKGLCRRELLLRNCPPWKELSCRDSVLARSMFSVVF